MIVGLGDLAGLVLNLLVQAPGVGGIVLASRNVAELERRRNLALLVGAQLGHYPEIGIEALDLFDADRTAEILDRVRPDVLLNTATLQSWRMITYLPAAVFRELDEAQFGPWLPMHLPLVHQLMRAVRAVPGYAPTVVNAAFPDAVGPVLRAAGLAPTVGIGNVANLLPALRGAVGLLLDAPLRDVRVSLTTQHYVSHRVPAAGDSGGAPYHARAYLGERDVSDAIDFEQAFALVRSRFQRTGGAFRQLITAASAVSVLQPLLSGEAADAHAPAPDGLPGGYPVRVSPSGVALALPPGLTTAEAIALNEACQRFDGIEAIAADGSVTFAAAQMDVMKRLLGYECRVMRLDEAHDRAIELARKYRAFAERHGLALAP